MTDEQDFKVVDLLPAKLEHLDKVLRAELGKNQHAASLAWNLVTSQATEALASVLDQDAFDLLAKGWGVARELHEYTDRTAHPRDERSVVHLGEHSVTTELHPVLKCRIGAFSMPPLRFTLELAANFKSVALSIADAHITGIGSGECYLSAQLKYGDAKLHPEQESKHVKLPGRLKFKAPGIQIV